MRNIKSAKKRLERVIDKIGYEKISMVSFCRLMNREFKPMSIRFHSKKSDYYSVSGNYMGNCDRDEELRYKIDITWDRSEHKFKPTRSFYMDIFMVLVHEFRHSYQDRKRNITLESWHRTPKFNHPKKKVVEEVNYLSDYDELDAYAYEVAFVFNMGTRKTIMSSWIVNRYRKALGKHAPKLYNKFLKKVYLYTHK
jgi:hypothetical protein